MAQPTVSETDATSTSESHQHRQQWLVEQALDGSGLPVVQARPTVFMENPALPDRVFLDRQGRRHQVTLRQGEPPRSRTVTLPRSSRRFWPIRPGTSAGSMS